MSVGCLDTIETIVPIVEQIVKHESKIRKLLKALKKCCTAASSSSDDESVVKVRSIVIQNIYDEITELCEGKVEWAQKDKRKWHKLANKLIKLGEWKPEEKKNTPWTSKKE